MKSFFAVVAILLACGTSYTMLYGTGLFPSTDFIAIWLLASLILVLSHSAKTFYFLLLPIALCYLLYLPIGLTFGAPSYQYVASVFATDLSESREFLSQLSIEHILLAFLVWVSLCIGKRIQQKHRLQFHRNKTFIVVSLALAFWASPASKFFHEIIEATSKVRQELVQLNSLAIASEWGTSTLSSNSRYDDYVLIIGESARRDYHHAYGYPIENTPFMSNAKGILIEGLTAGGTNTISSLKLMLTKPNTEKWEGNYALSLVDLVKSAGLRTYWLSNQGYLGKFDTPISSLANKSDEKFFTKSGESFHQNISDFALLPKFEKVITTQPKGKRFIVLHLYGSHPISCDRLTDYSKIFQDDQIDKKYHNLNCYISTIKKTDEFLHKTYQILQKHYQEQGRTFSMIYFADHGLSHKISEENIDMLNLSKSRLHLNVPLFKISSDDHQRKVYQAVKSGLNFTDGIANWIGIDNPKLNKQIDLFSPESDKTDYGLQKIIDEHYDKVLDPAVEIKTK